MTAGLSQENKSNRELSLENAAAINGLELHFDFIDDDEERELITTIDKNKWLADLRRRVQHYGYKYDYKARRIDKSVYIGCIPDWMNFLMTRLNKKGIIKFTPDQAIVNEYADDQGIASHIDCQLCFGDTVISISLGSGCVFNFEKKPGSKVKIPVFLEPKTLMVMRGEARYHWYHGIPGRKYDVFNGNRYRRDRRISITFRKLIVGN